MIRISCRLIAAVLVFIFSFEQLILAAPVPSSVTFLENGFTRIKSISEFQPRWFGKGLVQDEASLRTNHPELFTQDHLLTTQDLLKMKGAGWFKKLFRKIAQFFQRAVQAVVKALQRIVSAVTKALTAVFGKTIGRALASLLSATFNFLMNTAHYLSPRRPSG